MVMEKTPFNIDLCRAMLLSGFRLTPEYSLPHYNFLEVNLNVEFMKNKILVNKKKNVWVSFYGDTPCVVMNLKDWLELARNVSIEIICPECGSSHIIKKGFTLSGVQRYHCQDLECGKSFEMKD